MRKRRTTEERGCQGVGRWRIPLSLQWAEVLAGKIACRKHVLGAGPTRPPPPTAIRDVHNEILVKAIAAGELVPK